MTSEYFAIGTTPANMVNIETIVSEPPNVLPNNWVNLLGSTKTQLASGRVRRDGFLSFAWPFDTMTHAQHRTLSNALHGGFLTASSRVYVATYDNSGRYIVVSGGYAHLPQSDESGQDYEIVNHYWLSPYTIQMTAFQFLYTSVSANTAITSSQRVVRVNTSGGNVTITLPAASSPAANTPFSIWKESAANSLIIQRAGSDTFVGGGTSITLTAQYDRAEVVGDGVSVWKRLVYA